MKALNQLSECWQLAMGKSRDLDPVIPRMVGGLATLPPRCDTTSQFAGPFNEATEAAESTKSAESADVWAQLEDLSFRDDIAPPDAAKRSEYDIPVAGGNLHCQCIHRENGYAIMWCRTTATGEANPEMPQHHHHEFETVLAVKGRVQIVYEDGSSILLESGQSECIPPMRPHAAVYLMGAEPYVDTLGITIPASAGYAGEEGGAHGGTERPG